MRVLGVRPLSDGYRTWTVSPVPSGLRWAQGACRCRPGRSPCGGGTAPGSPSPSGRRRGLGAGWRCHCWAGTARSL
ncbi:alpha-L-rhamnosidase C-terminal domain-containing protein [Streptomyces niveiscabiei]|uniref:alpha-L-rhamnosidase C-terminal domain-containing protein n=1 Tax=Streptomyces niveiscabiei TaxID=164115 RepID=UPI00389B2B96